MPSTDNEVSFSGCPYVQVLYPKTDFEIVAKIGVLFMCPKARTITVGTIFKEFRK
jgi:hypothetical protein